MESSTNDFRIIAGIDNCNLEADQMPESGAEDSLDSRYEPDKTKALTKLI